MTTHKILEELESVITDLDKIEETVLQEARLIDGEIKLKSSFQILDDTREGLIDLLVKSNEKKEEAAIFKEQRKNIVEIKKILETILG